MCDASQGLSAVGYLKSGDVSPAVTSQFKDVLVRCWFLTALQLLFCQASAR